MSEQKNNICPKCGTILVMKSRIISHTYTVSASHGGNTLIIWKCPKCNYTTAPIPE